MVSIQCCLFYFTPISSQTNFSFPVGSRMDPPHDLCASRFAGLPHPGICWDSLSQAEDTLGNLSCSREEGLVGVVDSPFLAWGTLIPKPVAFGQRTLSFLLFSPQCLALGLTNLDIRKYVSNCWTNGYMMHFRELWANVPALTINPSTWRKEMSFIPRPVSSRGEALERWRESHSWWNA